MTDAAAAATAFTDALAYFPVPGALPVAADRAAAVDALRRACAADADLADAWVLRIALGDDNDDVVLGAYRARTGWGSASAAAGFAIDRLAIVTGIDGYASMPVSAPDDLTTLQAARLVRANRQREAFPLVDRRDADECAQYVAAWALHWGDIWDRVADRLEPLTDSSRTDLADASRVRRGIALAVLGRYDEARMLFDEAVRSPHPLVAAWALYNRALVWRHDGQEQKAVEVMQASIDAFAAAGEPQHSVAQTAQKAIKDPGWKYFRSSPSLIASRSDPWDKSTEDPARAAMLERSLTITQAERDALTAAALDELDAQVGMARVKAEVRQLIAQARANQLRAARGMPVQARLSHLVFQGPPGTGKTTVARIIAKLYFALGLLRSDHVVESTRVDFIAEYLGQTAVKTKHLIDSALDGVLFIDEAYALTDGRGFSGGQNAYGQEAIAELVARMENDRDRLVVIAAGYSDDMDRFIESNPGLESRFATRVSFSSFTLDELVRIAVSVGERSFASLSPEAVDALRTRISPIDRETLDRLGNARFAREIVAEAANERDVRIMAMDASAQESLDDDALTIVTGEDMTRALDDRLAHIAPAPAPVGFSPTTPQ